MLMIIMIKMTMMMIMMAKMTIKMTLRTTVMTLRSFTMLDHELLLHWFAQNPSRQHPKLTGLPVGLTDRRKVEEGGQLNGDLSKMEEYLRLAPPLYHPDTSTSGRKDRDPRPTLLLINFKVCYYPPPPSS